MESPVSNQFAPRPKSIATQGLLNTLRFECYSELNTELLCPHPRNEATPPRLFEAPLLVIGGENSISPLLPEEGRRNGLYSAFYVLKTLMIMLCPFVPETMQRLRESLRLEPDVFRVEELGRPMQAGHVIGQKQPFFPAVPDAPAD